MKVDIVKLRYRVSGLHASEDVYTNDHESTGTDILSEIDDLSRVLRLNAEAMVLIQSIPDEGCEDKVPVGAAYENDSFRDKARIEDLKHNFQLLASRAGVLKKILLEVKAEVSLIKR